VADCAARQRIRPFPGGGWFLFRVSGVVGDEPQLPAAVGLAHERAQRRAVLQVFGDVAAHDQPDPAVGERLHDRARNTGEEARVEALDGAPRPA
jgi:hypothetical protein